MEHHRYDFFMCFTTCLLFGFLPWITCSCRVLNTESQSTVSSTLSCIGTIIAPSLELIERSLHSSKLPSSWWAYRFTRLFGSTTVTRTFIRISTSTFRLICLSACIWCCFWTFTSSNTWEDWLAHRRDLKTRQRKLFEGTAKYEASAGLEAFVYL